MAVQDDGNFVIYESNWNPLWAATNDPRYNFNEQGLIGPHFGYPCYPNLIC